MIDCSKDRIEPKNDITYENIIHWFLLSELTKRDQNYERHYI